MNSDFQYLFDYCEIPEDGRNYIITSPEYVKKDILDAYRNSPYKAKYGYFPVLITRFIYYDDTNRKLYHYLSHNNLEKILKTKTFLAGYQYEMNDSTEGKYSWNLALEILKTMNPSRKLIKEFEFERSIQPFDYYLISFTKSDYNQALQNYGDVAIEVNSKRLHEVLMRKYFPKNFKGLQSMKAGNAYSFVVNVIYDKELQKEYLENTLKIWKTSWELHDEEEFNFASMILHFYSLIFKQWKYHQEEEVRFLIIKIPDKDNKSYDVLLNEKKKIKIPFDERMMSAVIVNHTADRMMGENIDSIENKVKIMLKENGFEKVKVKKTALEY